MSYAKVHDSILDSSVWGYEYPTRIVWVAMLVVKDKNGFVHHSVGTLAKRARVTKEECALAIERFKGPDDDSRTKGPTRDGRRIEEVEGGWIVLNHKMYRELGRTEERRGYLAEKQAEHRSRVKGVNTCQQVSTPSTLSTESDTDTKTNTLPPLLSPPSKIETPPNFDEIYKKHPLLKELHTAICEDLHRIDHVQWEVCVSRHKKSLFMNWQKALKYVMEQAILKAPLADPAAFLDYHLSVYEKANKSWIEDRKKRYEERAKELQELADFLRENAGNLEAVSNAKIRACKYWGADFVKQAEIQAQEKEQRKEGKA